MSDLIKRHMTADKLARIFSDAGGSDALVDLLADCGLESSRELADHIAAQVAENARLREWALKAYTVVDWACGEGVPLSHPYFDCYDALEDGAILLGVETSEQASQALQEPK